MYSKNAWEKYSKDEFSKIYDFANGYKDFISSCKTERLCVARSIELAEENGFVNIDKVTCLKPGSKVYFINKDKNICLYVIGKKNITDGIRVLGAHIDSPRLDLKQNPLYEKEGFALLDTHYYGGIKKYQWVTLPLALYGVVIKKNGEKINVNIGDNDDDPIVGINDLLIHLSGEQMQKNAAKVIEGENLDLTIGSMSIKDGENVISVKDNILNILKEKYNIEEEDFLSAEIEVVPAGKARDFGLDRSLISGYGHDDRVCAYTSLKAILDIDECEYTSCCILVDKEEIGSVGATGAQSLFFENTILKLLQLQNNDSLYNLRNTLTNTIMLSSDVSAGVDPLYSSVNDPKNSAYLGKGVVFNKYTGARGKSGCNDANPEFIAWLRKVMDENSVNFQTAELGKVDQGGGGTIAYILGNLNMNVIDCGVPVLNMHSPWEVVSKVDVYETYLAYKVFLTK